MGHGRLRWALVAGAVLVASLGPTAAPASADPGTVPTLDPVASPVSGDVTITASSTAPSVQFFLDGLEYGAQAPVTSGSASVQWPTWSLPNGAHSWTAADCDAVSCNATQSSPSLDLTIANTPPTITAPADGSVVSGDVSLTATTAAPMVQFSVDSVAFGSPVAVTAGSASITWSTAALSDGSHTVGAAECDALGCNPAESSVTVTTVNSAPTITPIDGATVSGVVNIDAVTDAKQVQFSLDGDAVGGPVSVTGGKASIAWTTWGVANGGPYSWKAAAVCDNPGCTPPQSQVSLTVDNVTPTITAPSDGSVVSGDVTLSATTAAPMVQFSVDSVAFGSPVAVSAGSASVTWSTAALSDGSHTVGAAACDSNGCSPAESSVTVTTVNSAPTITPITPPVAGVVKIEATTAAKQVQFSLGGNAVGGPTSVTGGKASITWTTWGVANGSHSWKAAAVCDNPGCTPPQSTVSLNLANGAPAITSPANGDATGPTVTIDASAPGGGLAFSLDGTQVAFDATAPYSFTPSSPLSYESHTVSVTECDVSGVTCDGPSASVTFTVAKLTPSITSVSPSPFSPGDDGRDDRTSFRVQLPDPQRVTYTVRNVNGLTVQGPHSSAGLVGGGTHTYTWDGRNNAGKIVRDGVYTIVVETSTGSGPTLLQGSDRATVRVDHTPTAFTAITGKDATFYPVVDTYLDTFRPTVTVNEGGRLWMEITNAHGARVRLVAQPHASIGWFRLAWNGRNSKNDLMPAGKYGFRFLAEDRAGNRRTSRTFGVHLSHRRTVRKTIAIGRNGDMGRVSTTNAHCTLYSLGFSNFDHGLWLNNACDRGFEGTEFIYADYTFAVPGAVRYDDIRVRTKGETTHAPEPISALVYNFTDSTWDKAGTVRLTRNARAVVTTFGRIGGAHHVSLRHRVRIRIAVPDQVTPQDYDIARASIVISYRRLR